MGKYNIADYDRPSVAADIAVFGLGNIKSDNPKKNDIKELKILLVKRGESPFEGQYALPGGFLKKNETIEEAAVRELREETGLSDTKMMNLKMYSKPDRDPRGWIVSNAFLALVNSTDVTPEENSDADDAEWFTFSYTDTEITLTSSGQTELHIVINDDMVIQSDLAFDHGQIIYDAFKKLRDEVKHHDLAFDLMPELFTIAELQQPYELILKIGETKEGFRRKMMVKIEETNQFAERAAHRPTKLYKRKGE